MLCFGFLLTNEKQAPKSRVRPQNQLQIGGCYGNARLPVLGRTTFPWDWVPASAVFPSTPFSYPISCDFLPNRFATRKKAQSCLVQYADKIDGLLGGVQVRRGWRFEYAGFGVGNSAQTFARQGIGPEIRSSCGCQYPDIFDAQK